ncbi:PREDICTED: probable serine/threonine-protein kinase At1g54610 [Camelina sativa]|uniref:Probable serine/threonine-protein kinase At1g54610 n=1 Tax=Camelina sativa TaxID=90675 RepID=A0ABM0UH38_CAMSA|nr:PREDICTED: probable serine/threonine-protein kinase At1g54610 [Camelina sativa]
MGCISSKNVSCFTDQSPSPVPEPGLISTSRVLIDHSLEASHNSKRSRKLRRLSGSDLRAGVSLGLSHRNLEAEQAAAGWPAWLCSAASEAVHGWVPLKAEAFQKLEKIGQGTYSSVFRAREVATGKMVALKKVKFDNLQPESIRFMAREILILRKLNHPNIMKLEGIVTSRASSSIYLVFEYMEHDLAGLSSNPDIIFTESQIKCYMQQILWGLEHCHMRGVIHRDIKASNILVNNKGVLKLGDFGLANVITPTNKNQLTSRVVTLWYRAPELLMGSTSYGVSIDLWSVGCVFAEILMGKPILKGRTEIEQLHKIYKLCGSPPDSFWKRTKLPHATSFKPQHTYEATLRERCQELPTSGVFLLETFLSMEPDKRGTASSALNSEYFLTRPYACDPSSLPKYPPNKEMDAKYRDDMRRKRANLKLRDSGVGRKNKRPNRTKYDPKNYPKLPIRQDTVEVKNIPNEASRATKTTQGNYYKVSDLPMTTGPASGFSWAVKRRKDPDNISTLTYYQPSSRSQLSGTSIAFAKNTFLNLKPDNDDSVWEVQGDNYDDVIIEEVPSESKLSRIGERHGSLDGSGLDFSQREEDSPKKNLEHLQFGKQSISGPLIFKSGKIDEILKRNESNIRQAVRKSHFQREQDDR